MRLLIVSSFSLALLALGGCEASSKSPAPKSEGATHQDTAKKAGAASQPKSASADKGTSPATREQVDADGVIRRGTTLTSTAAMTVPSVFSKAKDLNGKPVKVSGTVEQVCAVKGCWMVLKEEDKTIRITSKGYKFFVPKDAKGKKATIEGDLIVKEMSKEEAQHLEDDAAAAKGTKAKQVTSGRVEVQIAATALELS